MLKILTALGVTTAVAAEIHRFPLKKRDNHEFVQSLIAAAKTGKKSSAKVSGNYY